MISYVNTSSILVLRPAPYACGHESACSCVLSDSLGRSQVANYPPGRSLQTAVLSALDPFGVLSVQATPTRPRSSTRPRDLALAEQDVPGYMTWGSSSRYAPGRLFTFGIPFDVK